MSLPAATLLLPAACLLDQALGDPRTWLHPVQVMGLAITTLRSAAEGWARSVPWKLRTAGLIITLLLVGGSGLAGMAMEHLALRMPWLGLPLLVVGLASALAGRSLATAVLGVVDALPDLGRARERLAWIVGRDVQELNETEILRAAAETASENAVDGLFAPLFWMGSGLVLWQWQHNLPGPLALAWGFKAASTLDSMLGYRRGTLRWLGTAGARLDDVLTWIPCRLVLLSLPVVSGRWRMACGLWRRSLQEGQLDPSPNAGMSQAIYANVVGMQLGGANLYQGQRVMKAAVGVNYSDPTVEDVTRCIRLTGRLEIVWVAVITAALACIPH